LKYAKYIQEILESEVVTSDMKQEEDWMGRSHRRSLRTNQRQGSKKSLIAMIESRLEAERPESVFEMLN